MISGLLGALYAILFVFTVSVIIGKLSSLANEKNQNEYYLFYKSLFLIGCSLVVILINTKYFLLDAVAKAGLTIAALLIVVLPILIISKEKNKPLYKKLSNLINKFI
ncbi:MULTISPECIES: hypothetical protein [Bacillaceae]|uniref:hypothetical protein n=1 Tax=Bacillaceae TaxID=186817 RepID=UPI001C59C298|nr:hypothetical protein [Rossellomorea sp. YZS02]MBW3111492.1 hypothetical protein [Bacillus sp. MCCB 382]MDX8344995.1 hypothetical protein [Rossellomorea sp. YZS02]